MGCTEPFLNYKFLKAKIRGKIGRILQNFWGSLDDYLTVFNSSLKYEEMSNWQKQAIIILLDKKGRDRTHLENWQPISIINVDAKIASKAIANRMKKVFPEIIHHNQSGFVKNSVTKL